MTSEEMEKLLSRGVAKIIDKEKLVLELKSGEVQRIKHGIDPTTADLHLGHSVVYHKLRAFQELGHQIVVIIGDFTARFGDPTGKLTARTFRTKAEVKKLASSYKEQLGKILDLKKIEFRYNSEWYDKMALDEFLRLVGNFTIHQMLERDMFQERIREKKPILIPELIYPILQAYDSAMIKADLAAAGSDQLFNEIQARSLQPIYGQKPQAVLVTPLLIGLDGEQKMSQSLRNFIGILEKPNEMYGKIMSLPDKLIFDYMRLATGLPEEEIKKTEENIKNQKINPMEAKKRLAFEIVKIYHLEKEAEGAEKFFKETFQKGKLPRETEIIKIKTGLPLLEILFSAKIASKSKIRQLFRQGAIEFNGEVITDFNFMVNESGTAKIGKKKFLKLKVD